MGDIFRSRICRAGVISWRRSDKSVVKRDNAKCPTAITFSTYRMWLVKQCRSFTADKAPAMQTMPKQYSPYDRPMWDSIQQGQMKLQRCVKSGTFFYPPGPCCPETLSFDIEWAPISGRAKLLS